MDHQCVFGLRRSGEIVWLLQGDGRASNFVGAHARPPFDLPLEECGHAVAMNAPVVLPSIWNRFLKLSKSPGFHHFLPIPRNHQEPIPQFHGRPEAWQPWFTTFVRMSSPTRSPFISVDEIEIADLRRALNHTNILPLVIHGVEARHEAVLKEVIGLAVTAPRRVVIVGFHAAALSRSTDIIDLRPLAASDLYGAMMLPMELIGSNLIRRYARQEDLWALPESRVDRRARRTKKYEAQQKSPK